MMSGVFPARVETERLLLQRWDADRDTEAFVELCADPEVMRFFGGPQGPTIAAAKSDAFARHWEMYGFGLWAARARPARDDAPAGQILGFVGLAHPLWLPGWEEVVEVGWRLRRDAWGHGYATEGGRAGLHHAAQVPGEPLERVYAFIDPANHASAAVATRLGLTRREQITHPRTGEPEDVFAIERP